MSKQAKSIIEKTIYTVAFPLLMFLVMGLINIIKGTTFFFSVNMIKQVVINTCIMSVIALAIYIQFKNGRFDFSGGATMILSAIIAGNIAQMTESAILFFVVSVLVAVLLSLITASVYSLIRVPIIICTIAITLVFESMTYLFFQAEGLNIVGFRFARFSELPLVLVPTILAFAVYIFYTFFTIEGRRSKLLAGNQKVAINNGINETKSVIICYLVAGVILGLGAVMYGSQNRISPQSNLSTSGILFSYIVPVFIGMFLGSKTVDALGIFVASMGMAILNYGLQCLGVGAGGIQQIIFGVFMLGFYAFSAKIEEIKKLFVNIKEKFKSKSENSELSK